MVEDGKLERYCDKHPNYKAMKPPKVRCMACKALYLHKHGQQSLFVGISDPGKLFSDGSMVITELP